MSLFQLHMLQRLIVSSYLTAAAYSIVMLLTTPLKTKMIDLLSQGALSFGSFLLGLMALLPMVLTVATPLGTATGVVYCYSTWMEQNEIVALRAGGMSTLSIALPGALAGAVGMLFTGAMSLYFLPIGFGLFEDIRFQALHSLSFDALHEGFNNFESGFTFYFQKRLSSDTVENVIIIDERNTDALVVQSAKGGKFTALQDGTPVVILEHGEQFTGNGRGGTGYKVLFESLMISLSHVDPAVDTRSWRGFFEEPVTFLLKPQPAMSAVAEKAMWAAEGHRRIVSPFLSLSYALFSVAVLLRGRNPRVGGSNRPIAVLVAVIAWDIMIYLGHAALIRVPELTPQYYMFSLFPAIAGIGLLLRADSPLVASRLPPPPRLRSRLFSIQPDGQSRYHTGLNDPR